MIFMRSLFPLIIAALSASGSVARRDGRRGKSGKGGKSESPKGENVPYEVWASDQSNSVAGESSAGVRGSLLWIWDSASIGLQLGTGAAAAPLGCAGDGRPGPCDLLDVFPPSLVQVDAGGTALGTLGDLPQFGRLHGMVRDPSQRYATANIFAPGGGYVGVLDVRTRGAVGLFRVGRTGGSAAERSVHMSFWTADGSAIIVANLHGKMIERIDVSRDAAGTVVDLRLRQGAAVYLGKGFELKEGASAFRGPNALGVPLVGEVTGSYADAGESSVAVARPSRALLSPARAGGLTRRRLLSFRRRHGRPHSQRRVQGVGLSLGRRHPEHGWREDEQCAHLPNRLDQQQRLHNHG